MKKITALLLTLAMLISALSLFSCNGGGNTPEGSDSGSLSLGSETTGAEDPKIDLSVYTIIRPERATETEKSIYSSFYTALNKKTGLKIKFTDDFVREGTEFTEAEYEILLGKTNRKESAEALSGLRGSEYIITVIGKKVVINAGCYQALKVALEKFTGECLTEGSTKIDAGVKLSADYRNSEFYSVLEGITMYAMGDSYFGGSALGKDLTWVNQLGDIYGMTYKNDGIGGSTVSDFTTDRNPMVKRNSTEFASKANVILLEGGRNDRNVGVPIGENTSKDTKTFLGALNTMIDKYLAECPDAMIILVTPWYNTGKASTGLSNVDYANAMVALAEYRNDPRVTCINASDKDATGINMDDASFRSKYCIKDNDVSHLNEAGMAYILPFFEKQIAERYSEFLKTKSAS